MRKKFLIIMTVILCLAGCHPNPGDALRAKEPLGTPTPIQFTPKPTLTPTITLIPTLAHSPTPDVPKQKIHIEYEDRVIVGDLLGEPGATVVILGHMSYPGESRLSWLPFARYLAGLGYAAFAFDFPYYGESVGLYDPDQHDDDVIHIAEYLLESGFSRLICIGAGLTGGIGCFTAAIQRPDLFIGLVNISGPFETTKEETTMLTMPKLLLCAANERYHYADAMRRLFMAVPPPKQFKALMSDDHATLMFGDPNVREELRELMVEFILGLEGS